MDITAGASKSLLLPGLLMLLTVAPCPGVEGARNRGPEVCSGGRGLGDKWFDGCQWCVCTVRGALCSRSECSSLVRQVAPCHEVGLRWTDGCYRCRCKRNGIACRLDVTCLLLRHRPVPCLADERCVCGLDGVPSCTAEVIDRQAFAAKRVDLILPPFLDPEAERYEHSLRMLSGSGGHRRRGLRASWGALHHPQRRRDPRGEEVSQELLITSDNMCRFGPRWYGGSLRCFCDVDGAITCGNPAFVTAFYDDFMVERKECEEGHVWEEGCSICSCRRNGVVFCRHDRHCRHRYDDDEEGGEEDENSNINLVDTDHYLPGFHEAANDLSDLGGDLPEPPANAKGDLADLGEDNGDFPKILPSREEGCVIGTRWNEDCQRCRCNHLGIPECVRRVSGRCAAATVDDDNDSDNNVDAGGNGDDYDYGYGDYDVRGREPTPNGEHYDAEEGLLQRHRSNGEEQKWDEWVNGLRRNLKARGRGGRRKPERNPRGRHAKPMRKENKRGRAGNPKQSRPYDNAAIESPATLKPFYNRVPRGPFMSVPKPAPIFRGPPAYSRPTAYRPSPCGRFKVGARFWKACNLCLCTTKGPRCQGKLCW